MPVRLWPLPDVHLYVVVLVLHHYLGVDCLFAVLLGHECEVDFPMAFVEDLDV